MKPASISDIKHELTALPPKRLLDVCLRLARHKKENKELLSYLLFEAHDEASFVESVKKEMDEQFEQVPKSGFYFIKKSIRKILRLVLKYGRYTSSKETELEMLLYFCAKLRHSGIDVRNNKTLNNLYNQQVKKLDVLMKSIHEDLHYDYEKQIQFLKTDW